MLRQFEIAHGELQSRQASGGCIVLGEYHTVRLVVL